MCYKNILYFDLLIFGYPMASDIKKNHWLFAATPTPWHDYILLLRLDRPIGTWLLLLPCFWGLAIYHDKMSAEGFLYYLIVFTVGAFALRSAGCVWNDILDREFDKKVARTRQRPLASGRISLDRALWVLVTLLSIGFFILVALDNHPAQVVALLSLALVVPYPLMKRLFPLPQLWLGFTFNIGVLVAGVIGSEDYFDIGLWWLYAIGILWTMAYDTIYALQDKDDDELLGLKSSALFFGKEVKKIVGGFYLLMAMALVGLVYYLDGNNPLVGYGLCVATMLVMWSNYQKINPKKPAINLQVFRRQWMVGVLILLVLYYA